ncbi:MAG TPA: SDR family NAD(P)-dependent oxidoreductase, partial [Steroidobacteraceae bacterium]|nr:SDR family NAD(P)-dependent oxidoreductase [Steroidobacteraceae bacterium]
MKELSGRVALVTGAASGIGAAIVARFQGEGARVIGLDIAPGAAGYYSVTADVRSAATLDNALTSASEKLG